ncbi:MAG: MFS transporter [Deltaproteobacteria bacterium]|nr:MAG: MFS transporter [Deltaproteobacteria bacterium]
MKKNVYLLGLLSLFNDISADMVAPLLPAYLLSLGAGAPLLGVMEGLANTLSHVTVLFSGYYSDRHLKTKKITVLGYRLCSVVRVLIAFPLLPVIVSARLLDRIGKGIRTAPRDRLLISSVPEKEWGKAFGIQRALDHTGSLLAPLISSFLISIFALSYTKLFFNSGHSFFDSCSDYSSLDSRGERAFIIKDNSRSDSSFDLETSPSISKKICWHYLSFFTEYTFGIVFDF